MPSGEPPPAVVIADTGSFAGQVWVRSVAVATAGGAVVGAVVGLLLLSAFALDGHDTSFDVIVSVLVVGPFVGGAIGAAMGLPLGMAGGLVLAYLAARRGWREPWPVRFAASGVVLGYFAVLAACVDSGFLLAAAPGVVGALIVAPSVIPRPRHRARFRRSGPG